jgi:hypothetical protein
MEGAERRVSVPIARVKHVQRSIVAAVILAAAASHLIQAQDAVVPSGRLVFRSSSLEFRPEGTFFAHGSGRYGRSSSHWNVEGALEHSRTVRVQDPRGY